MARKPRAAAPAEEPAGDGEPSLAGYWDAAEPGSRLSHGVYSVYKTRDGGLLISYRRDGDDGDCHLPVPAAMVAMMLAATEGRGPLGRMRALAGKLSGGGM